MKIDIYVHQGQLVVPLDQVNALIKVANPLGNINTDPNLRYPQAISVDALVQKAQQAHSDNKQSELEKQARINHGY